MKPLILLALMLSTAVGVQAQTIADAARKERERQARVQTQTTRVFTTEDAKRNSTVPEPKPEDSRLPPGAKPEDAAAADAADAAEAAAAPAPAVDPVQQWTEETGKLRTKVRQLMDQERALQLEMNRASAQMNAPVTTQSAKDQAAKTLEASQTKILGIRSELAKNQEELREKDLQGPPQQKK
jgi:hypothetical protein